MFFEMLKKLLFSSLFVVGFGFIFSSKAFAAVDISLEDTTDTIEVTVDSNKSYIDGVDMRIVFSEGMSIESTELANDSCTLSSKAYTKGGSVYIECLNDLDTEMEGVLATITYSTEVEDYYFYVDQDTLDVGSLTLGEVTDVNKPEETVVDETEDVTDTTETEEEASLLDKVITFLSDNSLYVLGGVGLLLVIVVAILGFGGKKEEPVVQE